MKFMMRYGKARVAAVAVLFMLMPNWSEAADKSGPSWLDASPANWNKPGTGIPAAPEAALEERCRDQVRAPANEAEEAIARAGWKLYGPVQKFSSVTIILAMAGTDGMCRPMRFQAFVFSGGRYAGTLSPVPMDSRGDSSLTKIESGGGGAIQAEFARYVEADALCCPSRRSTVTYKLERGRVPQLTPLKVVTKSTAEGQ